MLLGGKKKRCLHHSASFYSIMGSLIFTLASLIHVSYRWEGISYTSPVFRTWKQISGTEELLLTVHIIGVLFFFKGYTFDNETVHETKWPYTVQKFTFPSETFPCKDWGKATGLLWLVKGTRAQLVPTCWQEYWVEKGDPSDWNTKWGILIKCDDTKIEFSESVIHLQTILSDKGTVSIIHTSYFIYKIGVYMCACVHICIFMHKICTSP